MRIVWTCVLNLVAGLGAVGCSQTVTRRSTVTADEAVALARTHVVHTRSTEHGVAVDVEYKASDEVPGEGVVRIRADSAMWSAGVVMMIAGTLFTAAGCGWLSTYHNDDLLPAIGGISMAISGGFVAAAGIGLTIAGFVRRVPVIEPRVTVTPVVSHDFGGAMFEVGF